MILFCHLSCDHPLWPRILGRSCYSSPSNTEWVPLGCPKKKGSSECLPVCVVKPQRRGTGGGIIWADVDENGIDHISRLSFTPFYLGGRRERQAGRENISERHERGNCWRDNTLWPLLGATQLSARVVAKKQISCADIHKVWNQRMSSLQPCCLCFAVWQQFSQIITQKLCPLCLLQEWSF